MPVSYTRELPPTVRACTGPMLAPVRENSSIQGKVNNKSLLAFDKLCETESCFFNDVSPDKKIIYSGGPHSQDCQLQHKLNSTGKEEIPKLSGKEWEGREVVIVEFGERRLC